MSRPPATSRKVGRVVVLLALFLVCLRATQTAWALLGAGAVPVPRSVPPVIWAQNLLVARRAKAGRGEAQDSEDVKGPLQPREDEDKATSETDDVAEATAEATASFDQVSRNKPADEAASAQTADPVEDAKQASEPSESEDDEDKEQAASAQTADPVEDANQDDDLQTSQEKEDPAPAQRVLLEVLSKQLKLAASTAATVQKRWQEEFTAQNDQKAQALWEQFVEVNQQVDRIKQELKDAKPDEDWCGRLLQKKLTFGQGTPPLSTIGFDWDYCGKEDLLKNMRAEIQQLHEAKGRGQDKQAHPLFIAFAGPGQGKSRLLTEFPGLVGECLKDLKNRRFSDEPLAFLLTCENGMGPGDWGTQELNAQRFVACRMLWQLREANQQAFDDTGAPQDFAQFRASCSTTLSAMDVLQQVLPSDQIGKATVVIGLDGMHNLPGFPQRGEKAGKEAPFYQVIQEVCRLINQDTPPFVVACVTATQSVSQGLANSPQARKYLKLPRVTAVTRNNSSVLPPDDLIQLLAADMGGHGRALECLEEVLNGQSMCASALLGAVMSKLYGKYPDAATFAGANPADVLDLLRAALSGKVLRQKQTIGAIDPAKMELIRVAYLDESIAEYRIDIPYIWLQVMLSQQTLAPDLGPWKLLDYNLLEKPAALTWQDWEQFNADFRVLRSCSFEDGQAVKIGLLHRGAIIQPSGFEHQVVVNRHLTLAEAKSRLSSRASCCGHPKPRINWNDSKPAKGLKKFQCRVTLAGKDVVVSMADKTTLVVNRAGAPAADAFLMLGERTAGNEQLISECLQFKMGSSIVKATEERHKACDNNDILVLLLNRAENSPASQDRLVLVSAEQFEEYYGLYAGRAFLLKDVKIAQDPCVNVPFCPVHLLS